ncbi:SecY-interacting protein [Mixta gaviniae]|uniref:Protein Syd n=1 Tax=Mixta gaviniae TaxID=665914 RepID=A0A1X1DH05_9GAMM|nr:SecY-interacting protein [Mixta gaviniae]AUX95525.1 SecY-interacting protein [Mixta gaviniae]ORM76003.1 SecY-interacting protein [Mixta gaviniae]
MNNDIATALRDFTQRYCQQWQQQHGHLPASADLYGIASPCEVESRDGVVLWRPQPFSAEPDLAAVERALELRLQPAAARYYTTQYAGDMQAMFEGQPITLLQVWSEADFARVQENLIGHLVMKRRLKQTPTLFIATTESDLDVVSLCNLSGEVVLEKLGTPQRKVLAPDIQTFLNSLQPVS